MENRFRAASQIVGPIASADDHRARANVDCRIDEDAALPPNTMASTTRRWSRYSESLTRGSPDRRQQHLVVGNWKPQLS